MVGFLSGLNKVLHKSIAPLSPAVLRAESGLDGEREERRAAGGEL